MTREEIFGLMNEYEVYNWLFGDALDKRLNGQSEKRHTFVVPEGYVAVEGPDGRATGEVRPFNAIVDRAGPPAYWPTQVVEYRASVGEYAYQTSGNFPPEHWSYHGGYKPFRKSDSVRFF